MMMVEEEWPLSGRNQGEIVVYIKGVGWVTKVGAVGVLRHIEHSEEPYVKEIWMHEGLDAVASSLMKTDAERMARMRK